MNKKDIVVPTDVMFLSDWDGFDLILPQGKVILNKNICGCGCTEYYLRNDLPIVLVSPRKELINCKMNSQRPRPLFYFDRSKTRVSADKTIIAMKEYLRNPYSTNGFVPKILVTYDSLKMVLDTLSNENCIDRFTIIVDEFTCIFTDVKLKGFIEMNLIHKLNNMPNHTVYISATPISDTYLDELDEFKFIPYVTLIWDKSRYENVNISRRKMINTRTAIGKIIAEYRQNGYFKTKLIDGKQLDSTEAVFFLNSVNDITAVIKNCNLTPEETLVICADDAKNKTALNKVGFSIGHVPGKNEYKTKNKTFTFVTKASFEGTDFYSDNSSTYIFADSNRDNLCLDISIDLPQIIGRCRTVCNPFRLEVSYFYKTSDIENIDVDAAMTKINCRMDATMRIINSVKNITDKDVLEKFSTAQVVDKYSKDYVDMLETPDGKACVVCNKLAYLADMRAIEIKSMQYKTTYSVLTYLMNNGYKAFDYYGSQGDQVSEFYNEFMADGNFSRKMKLYVETVELFPEIKKNIEGIAEIPLKFKRYYNIVGAEKIKALCYREADLEKELNYIQSEAHIKEELVNRVEYGKAYTNLEIKGFFLDIYSNLRLDKKAKAVDITKYIPSVYPTKIYVDGKRQWGYRIQ